MKKIACLGTEAFTLGFQLAGIREARTVASARQLLDEAHKLRADKSIGIVITDEEVLALLDGHERSELQDSVEPVFIAVSAKAGSGDIRKMIIKSIGVDLWKGDDAPK
ncbi:MAG: V-type ATP synthase subunit F [Nanoarchaeota archaeon]|nr:V-type ATP synthase subunit F [Nanoarchaeota archaeon]